MDANDFLNPEAYFAMGIREIRGEIDGEKTAAFRERILSDPSDGRGLASGFKVLTGEGDSFFLLKSHLNQYNQDDPEALIQGIEGHQREVFSYRIAYLLDYPVPKTCLVQFEGSVYVAYEYFEGADNCFLSQNLDQVEGVSNHEALWNRVWFNLLIDASIDSAEQGIVIEGKYYAQDFEWSLRPDLYIDDRSAAEFSDDELVEALAKLLVFKTDPDDEHYYGMVPSENDDVKKSRERFFNALGRINREALELVFTDFIGTEACKEFIITKILQRVKILPAVYEKYVELSNPQ